MPQMPLLCHQNPFLWTQACQLAPRWLDYHTTVWYTSLAASADPEASHKGMKEPSALCQWASRVFCSDKQLTKLSHHGLCDLTQNRPIAKYTPGYQTNNGNWLIEAYKQGRGGRWWWRQKQQKLCIRSGGFLSSSLSFSQLSQAAYMWPPFLLLSEAGDYHLPISLVVVVELLMETAIKGSVWEWEWECQRVSEGEGYNRLEGGTQKGRWSACNECIQLQLESHGRGGQI